MVDLEVQTIAAKLAFEFNGQMKRVAPDVRLKLKLKLKVLMPKLVRIATADGSHRVMAMDKQYWCDPSDFR